MYASETIQNCKNPTGHIDTLIVWEIKHYFEKNTHTFEFEKKKHVLDTIVYIINFGMLQVVKILCKIYFHNL